MDQKIIHKVLDLTDLKGREDLSDLLVELRDEFLETGEFTSKVLTTVDIKYWDIVSYRIGEFRKYIESRTDFHATLTTCNKFCTEEDTFRTHVYLVWKGSW